MTTYHEAVTNDCAQDVECGAHNGLWVRKCEPDLLSWQDSPGLDGDVDVRREEEGFPCDQDVDKPMLRRGSDKKVDICQR